MITVTQEMHAQVQPGYKICADCGQLLALENYHYNARASDLRVSTCRECLRRQRAARKARSKLPEPEQPVVCRPSVVSPALFDPAEVVAGWDAGETIQSLSGKYQRNPKHISRIIRAAGRETYTQNPWMGRKRPIPAGNTRRWTPAEDDLIRVCPTPLDARIAYEAEYPKKRTQNAIRKHYHDLRALGRSQ